MSNAPASREELIRAAHAELDQVLHYKPAERIDHLPIGLLDILYAYRLFLGRWPEFDSMETYRQVMGPPHGLWALLTGFLNAPEFKVRIPELAPADMIVMHQLPGGLRLHFNLKDRQSMRIASGIHELEIQQAILSVLKPGMNCVDAGAHIGLYSLLMGRVVGLTGGKVYCFEPFPSTWELLIRNIQENHLEDTILPTNAACHAAPATGRIFEREKEDLGEAYVETEQHAGGGGTQVKLVRVDDIVPANIRIGIIKIDIEGSEPPAMMGMERILKNDRPIIFTEFNPGALESVSRTNPADYLKFLKNHGYRCRQVQHFLAGVNEEYSYAAGDQTTNLVCEPQ